MINKIISTLLLSVLPLYAFANIKSSGLELALTENLDLQKATYIVPLDNLKEKILYKVHCKINSIGESETKIMLEPRLLASSSYGNARLNHKPLVSNAGKLQEGNNQISFHILIGEKDEEQYNRFVLSNLSSTPMQVTQCLADEVSPSTNALTTAKSARSRGFFFAYNDTSSTVTISVGNILPSEYIIQPHDWRTVIVSTDNQSIHIKQIQ